MQAIKKKLRSRRGASLTFALLIFLVCAVLSSVIIVAASTAAGRMSKLAETDRRYYAVTSAAELMKDLLKEPVSIVERTEVTTISKTTRIRVDTETTKFVPTGELNEAGEPIIEEIVSTERKLTNLTDPPKKTPVEKIYLLPKAAEKIENADYNPNNQISGTGAGGSKLLTDSIVNEAAYKVYMNEAAQPPREIQMKPSVDAIPEVKIEEELKPKASDRLLTLKIFDTGEKPYTLKLQFQGTPNPSMLPSEYPTPPSPESETKIDIKTEEYEEVEDGITIRVVVNTTTTTTKTTETSIKIDTKISTINWDLVDISTKTSS